MAGTDWVELRIHGVSGTPPENMLESAHVKQVAGDEWGRFFRPVNGVGTEVQTTPVGIPQERLLEVRDVDHFRRDLDTVSPAFLHGLLHLCGYDHETDNGEMNRLELRLRRRLGL